MKIKFFILFIFLSVNPIFSELLEYYVTSPKGLDLRESPDQKSKVIILIPFKSKILIISDIKKNNFGPGCDEIWTNVDFNGTKGWVYGRNFSNKKPKAINKDNCNNISRLNQSFNSNIIKYKNFEFKFGIDDDEVLKLYGKPNKFYNLEWGGFFEYNDFLIGFNEYFFDDNSKNKTKDLKHKAFTLRLSKEKFILEEIIITLGKPSRLFLNCEDSMWYCEYENNLNIIFYVFSDLNEDIKYIEIINKNK
jgi:hypothetical protein